MLAARLLLSGSADRPLKHRLKTGVPGLDELMGGGIPQGYSVLVAGPSGSGKTVLSNQFIVEGVRNGENGIVAVFEKRPNDYLQTTPRGEEFEKLVREKRLVRGPDAQNAIVLVTDKRHSLARKRVRTRRLHRPPA